MNFRREGPLGGYRGKNTSTPGLTGTCRTSRTLPAMAAAAVVKKVGESMRVILIVSPHDIAGHKSGP